MGVRVGSGGHLQCSDGERGGSIGCLDLLFLASQGDCISQPPLLLRLPLTFFASEIYVALVCFVSWQGR